MASRAMVRRPVRSRKGKAHTGGQRSFSASIEAFAKRSLEDIEFIFKEAAQRVIEEMQRVGPSVARPGGGAGGRMPVDLGFLRASLVATLNQPTTGLTVPSSDVQSYRYDEGQVSLVILAARLGDSIYAVYTAAYARRMEYGFTGKDSLGRDYDQGGYGFVRLAAQQWQDIVGAVVREAKQRRGET